MVESDPVQCEESGPIHNEASNTIYEEQEPVQSDHTSYDDFNDYDSTLGEEEADLSSTTSVGSSILRYRQENGRTYHAYKDGKYLLPNDEGENDRLDLQHHMYYLTLKGKLYMAPIPKEQKLHRVLDLGTGTGIWAIDFADEHPETQVLGVDLSPIQPAFVPPNCHFEIDDIEEPWSYSYKFDLINMRMMVGCVSDWPKCFSQCLEFLNPGGWLEVKDIKFPIEDNGESFGEECAVKRWSDLILEGTVNLGRPCDSAKDYKRQLEEAGFEDVVEVRYKWPQNRWPKDRKMKELGMWMHENFSTGLAGLSMAVFTRGLGWSQEELQVFLTDVRKSMKDPSVHGYYPIYAVYGRKPL
ncbi:related to methyltransferase [Rhynchosporium secalis]|uniref:Related to methyltransferase n=1 Tax=Rhynchosporium secalis TaxID=38038 RepID=A0A1E1MJC2_RHYSE|nr:related to methyltransferase [Rhynchosporium secalis]